MAEPVYGLSQGAINALTPIVRQHKGRLPDAGRRTRKVYDTGSGMRRYRITQTLDDDGTTPVAVYRTSHASGFNAVALTGDSDTSTGPEKTIYATSQSVRSVFRTNDIVWCRRIGSETQIIDFGRVHWTGITVDSIMPTGIGTVILYSGENVEVEAENWSAIQPIASDTQIRIEWDDERQRFLIVAARCPELE